jgi:hypothetical protein
VAIGVPRRNRKIFGLPSRLVYNDRKTEKGAAMPHKLKTGQSVILASRREVPAVYTIVRFLPELPNGEPQYRIKSVMDGTERVVREVEINPA